MVCLSKKKHIFHYARCRGRYTWYLAASLLCMMEWTRGNGSKNYCWDWRAFKRAKPSKAHAEQSTAPGERSSLVHHSIIIHPRIETESILILRSLPSFIASGRRCSKLTWKTSCHRQNPRLSFPFFRLSFTIFSSTFFLFLKFGTLLAGQNYRFLSEETSHNLSPGRWGRGGSEDFQGITWFSGGTVAADHSSPAEYWMPINWKWKVTIRILQL